jgi:hypothetical protein
MALILLAETGKDKPAWLGGKADTQGGAFYWLSDRYPVDQDLFHEGQPDNINDAIPPAVGITKGDRGLDDLSLAVSTKYYPFCRLCPGNANSSH